MNPDSKIQNYELKTIDLIKKYTKHKNVKLVHRGNAAILCAFWIVKHLSETSPQFMSRPKTILVPDMGGWFSFKTYPQLFGMNVELVKTDNGIIDLVDLKQKVSKCSAFIVTSLAGYFAEQPLKEISAICKTSGCLLIEDASPAFGDEVLCDGSLSDIIVCSFGNHKPVSNGYGGFISVCDSKLFNESSPIFSSTNFQPKSYSVLIKKVASVSKRLKKMYLLQEKVKQELKNLGFDVVHADKRGLNVIVRPKSESESQRIIEFCKQNNYEFVQCPTYIRLEHLAISIELKRLK